MAPKLPTIALAAALAVTGCKKKGPESAFVEHQSEVTHVDKTITEDTVERDMTNAPFFESKKRYGTSIVDDEIDRIRGFKMISETEAVDLKVEDSGKDLIDKGARNAKTLAIYAVDEDKNLQDPNRVNGDSRIRTITMTPANQIGFLDFWCLDANGDVVKQATSAGMVNPEVSGNGGYRGEVACWTRPGEKYGVRVTYQTLSQEHGYGKIRITGERFFVHLDPNAIKAATEQVSTPKKEKKQESSRSKTKNESGSDHISTPVNKLKEMGIEPGDAIPAGFMDEHVYGMMADGSPSDVESSGKALLLNGLQKPQTVAMIGTSRLNGMAPTDYQEVTPEGGYITISTAIPAKYTYGGKIAYVFLDSNGEMIDKEVRWHDVTSDQNGNHRWRGYKKHEEARGEEEVTLQVLFKDKAGNVEIIEEQDFTLMQ